MAILAGFLVVLVNIFFVISTNSSHEEARAEVQQNLRFASSEITEKVRSSSDITVPVKDGQGNTLDITLNDLIVEFRVQEGVLQKIQSATGATCAPGDGCQAGCGSFDTDCTPENITADNVIVSFPGSAPFIFTRTESGNAKPSIQINLAISYNDKGRPDYKFSEVFQTTVSVRQ